MASTAGLSIACVVVGYFFAIVGKFLIEFIRGFQFDTTCWPWPAKKVAGCFTNVRACARFTMPPLVGMIVFGCLSRNLMPYEPLMKYFPDAAAAYIREAGLGLIMIRAGTELDARYITGVVIYAAVLPPLMEAIAVGLAAQHVLSMTSNMAFQLGFAVAAVAPGIIVPLLLDLQRGGYGVRRGIPTMVVSSSSLTVIFCIILYSVCLNITQAQVLVEGGIVSGQAASPGTIAGIAIGKITAGFVVGGLVGYGMRITRSWHAVLKVIVSLAIDIVFVFMNTRFQLSNASLLATLAFGYTANTQWKKKDGTSTVPRVEYALVWKVIEPLFFCTVGAAINFRVIRTSMIVDGVWMAVLGASVRVISTILWLGLLRRYTIKEMLLVAFMNLPRASVQAALGPQLYDYINKKGITESSVVTEGVQVMSIALTFAIILAPIGSLLSGTFGQILLEKFIAPDAVAALRARSRAKRRWDSVRIVYFDFKQRRLAKAKASAKANENVSFNVPQEFILSEEEFAKRVASTDTTLSLIAVYRSGESSDIAVDAFAQRSMVRASFDARVALYAPFNLIKRTYTVRPEGEMEQPESKPKPESKPQPALENKQVDVEKQVTRVQPVPPLNLKKDMNGNGAIHSAVDNENEVTQRVQ